MSFSSRIKEELSRHMSPARHCQIAEIAAILSLCGRIQISGDDHYSIKIHLAFSSEYSNRNLRIKSIDFRNFFLFKIIDDHFFLFRINKPVLSYPGILILH